MKILIKNILLLSFTAYFLFAGLGFNVVNYCCAACEAAGIDKVAHNSCSAVHHEKHNCCESESNEDIACDNIAHHPNSCHLTRLTLANSVLCNPLLIDNFELHLFSFSIPNNQLNNFRFSEIQSEFEIPPPEDKRIISAREILITKATFLI